MKTVFIYLINFYQKFLSFDSGILAYFTPGGACRYEVSCSEYTKQAILKVGAIKGVISGIRRIISCR